MNLNDMMTTIAVNAEYQLKQLTKEQPEKIQA